VQDDLIRVAKKLGYNDDAAKWTGAFKRNPRLQPDAGELVVILNPAGRDKEIPRQADIRRIHESP
jgi:hypothetical protein